MPAMGSTRKSILAAQGNENVAFLGKSNGETRTQLVFSTNLLEIQKSLKKDAFSIGTPQNKTCFWLEQARQIGPKVCTTRLRTRFPGYRNTTGAAQFAYVSFPSRRVSEMLAFQLKRSDFRKKHENTQPKIARKHIKYGVRELFEEINEK